HHDQQASDNENQTEHVRMLSSTMLLPNLIPLIDVTFSTPTGCCNNNPSAPLRLALLFVYQVSLDRAAVWCSEGEILAVEHELDILSPSQKKHQQSHRERVFRTRCSTFGRKLEPQNKAHSSRFVDSD
ncbi:MAG: hypothetical protein WBV60_00610, partial [Terriglobales bacterium]